MRLAFNDDGQGTVLVLVHGFPFDRSMWSNQRSSVGSMARLITPDLRGFGETRTPDDGDFSVDTLADDVIELLDTLRIDQPIVIGGLSMGGYVALSIAVGYADRVKGLVLLNSRAEADSPEIATNRLATADRIESSGDTSAFVAGMVPRLFARSTIDERPELVRGWESRMAKVPPRTIVGTLRGLATRPDRSADLARVAAPTLVVAGSDDQIVPLDESRRIAEAFPDGRLVVVDRSGHLTPLENAPATNAALIEFLEQLV